MARPKPPERGSRAPVSGNPAPASGPLPARAPGEPVRILAVMQKVCYPPKDGATQRQFNLLRAVAANCRVDLLAFSQRDLEGSAADANRGREMLQRYCEGVEVFPIPAEHSRLRRGALLLLNLASPAPFPVQRHRSRAMGRSIGEHLRRRRYDLIHLDATILAEYGRLAPGIPALLVHHNVESELLRRRADGHRGLPGRLYLRLQAWKMRRFETRVAPAFRAHVAVSEADRALLLGHCPGADVRVISNGTDTEHLTPDPAREQARNLLFVGSMNWAPNPDAVLFFLREIWPLIKRDLPDAALDVVGIAPPPPVLEAARQDPAIRVHGFVEDVRPHLARATVFVVPLRMGGGTRLKILDAMAMGKAIVSTSIGAEGLGLEPGAEILLADRPADFAAQVVRLVNDPELRRTLGRNARARAVASYSWPRIGRDLLALYEQIAAAPRR